MAEDGAVQAAEDDLRALLGEGPVPFPERIEREFQPWHRPRKQFVRSCQWARELGYLVRDLKLADRPLRYLTLPGSDLLDIRHFADSVCAPHKVQLKYLGFNTAAQPSDPSQTELNTSQFSLNRLDYIHPESEVVPGDFRIVGDTRSIPWRSVRKAGPFHAINLDLCGGFAGREKADGIPNYFTALQAVLQNQKSSDEDFLLFITTRMDDDNIDGGTQAALSALAQDIYDTCHEYATAFAAAWGIPLASAEQLRLPDVVGTAEAFMLGLTQWIVSQGVTHGLKASVRTFMTYRTGMESGPDDIVSLAIRFKPDPFVQPDAQGLVIPVGTVVSSAEKLCHQSAKIPGRVRRRLLVDEILRTQASEFQRVMSESSGLLAASGYDVSSYQDWVMQESDRYATV